MVQRLKNLPAVQEILGDVGFDPWVGKIPWKKKWQPTSVFFPEKIPWTEEPGRLQSMGVTKSGTQLSD